MELEGQLANLSQQLSRLVSSWRALPVGAPTRTRIDRSRKRQRAEDRLGREEVAQLLADYQAGQPSTALMRTYGLSKGAVLRLLEVNGIPRRRRGLSDQQVKDAVQLYRQGGSLTAIGDYFGKDHSVVRNALKRADVTFRR